MSDAARFQNNCNYYIVSKPQLYYCVRALFVIASTIASLVAVKSVHS